MGYIDGKRNTIEDEEKKFEFATSFQNFILSSTIVINFFEDRRANIFSYVQRIITRLMTASILLRFYVLEIHFSDYERKVFQKTFEDRYYLKNP